MAERERSWAGGVGTRGRPTAGRATLLSRKRLPGPCSRAERHGVNWQLPPWLLRCSVMHAYALPPLLKGSPLGCTATRSGAPGRQISRPGFRPDRSGERGVHHRLGLGQDAVEVLVAPEA